MRREAREDARWCDGPPCVRASSRVSIAQWSWCRRGSVGRSRSWRGEGRCASAARRQDCETVARQGTDAHQTTVHHRPDGREERERGQVEAARTLTRAHHLHANELSRTCAIPSSPFPVVPLLLLLLFVSSRR